jgi:UDP-N-acetylmuramoyl-L-alanyl-D-glutamate--2,6-diaminopimelate ligase
MEFIRETLRKLIPKALFRRLQPTYHYLLALLGALWYRFPSRKLTVIAVTGTKGKSSVVEITNAIFEAAGYTTACANTIRFKVGDVSEPNLYKMSVPGRTFMQHFLWRAVQANCTVAIIEMTSEAAKMYRHSFIEFDTLIFTNLTPEHIESHGSFDAYKLAKLSLRDALIASPKSTKFSIANRDDPHGVDFLDAPGTTPLPYRLSDVKPFVTNDRGVLITFQGTSIHSPLVGTFNIYNLLAAASAARAYGIEAATIKRALEQFSLIQGRAEKIAAGQPFTAVVDYAHTPESLEAVYTAFPMRKICVLGNTGGGRDRWKRPKMGEIADQYCDHIILTNEDPYDEDPRAILAEMESGITTHTPEIILDRREAISRALSLAGPKDAVLITGKGTDPYIMGANGTKEPWSDARVVREELEKLRLQESGSAS